MKGLAVVDDLTFTVKLTSPQASFPLRLGYTAFFPLPQAAYKDIKAFGEAPIGDGPYMLEGAWVHNVDVKVKKNPDYKGTYVAKNAGVDVKVYTDQNASYTDLRANNVDVVQGIPDNALASFTSDLGSRAINQPAGVFQAFDFPLYQPEWKGDNAKKVRQAISMAIDRKTITEKIFQGTRTPANDFSSPVVAGYDPSICGDLCVFDPAKAKAKLAEAGGFTGKFEIAYNADGGNKSWVDAVCNSIKNTLAIDCSGKSYPDSKSLRDPITKGAMKTAFRARWQMEYPALENFLAPLYAKGAGSNDSHYDNPAFDALLKKGDTAKTLDESIADFQDAERLVVQDMPSIPLWYSNTIWWLLREGLEREVRRLRCPDLHQHHQEVTGRQQRRRCCPPCPFQIRRCAATETRSCSRAMCRVLPTPRPAAGSAPAAGRLRTSAQWRSPS